MSTRWGKENGANVFVDRHDLIAFGKAIPGCDETDGILRDEGDGKE